MSKDAKGHGSEKRGGPNGPGVTPGGKASDREAARSLATPLTDEGKAQITTAMKAGGASDEAIAATLAGGHPKSAAVPVHGGAAGLNAWGQTPATARAVRKQLRQARAARAYSKGR